jgi:hypothetical protein
VPLCSVHATRCGQLRALWWRSSSGPPAKEYAACGRDARQPTRRQGQGKRSCWRAKASGPPRPRPCLRAVWRAWENVAGVPACAGSPPISHHSGGACCVCCCVSCVWLWPGLVAGLPVWRCVWLVSVPVCSVCLAVCSGCGICLPAGGGVCAGLLLACWCSCGPSGGGALQIKRPSPGDKAGGGLSQPRTTSTAGTKKSNAGGKRQAHDLGAVRFMTSRRAASMRPALYPSS